MGEQEGEGETNHSFMLFLCKHIQHANKMAQWDVGC